MKVAPPRHAAALLAGGLIVLMTTQGVTAQTPQTIHVAVNGQDTNPGTTEEPVVTVNKAVALVDGSPGSGVIVIHGGVYALEKSIVIRRPGGSVKYDPDRKLTIQAADNEKVVFDGSLLVDDLAVPLAGTPGVYTVKGDFPTDQAPAVWEEETDARFLRLANLEAVKGRDHSCVVLDRTTLALRARNGAPPKGMKIRMGRTQYGLWIIRGNVTVKRICFQNFNISRASTAIRVGDEVPLDSKDTTNNTVMDSCESRACYRGFWIGNSGVNTLITRCQVRNPVTGVFIQGTGTTVEYCTVVRDYGRMSKTPDENSEIENDGLRIYYYAKDATVHGNLFRGFSSGAFCKMGAAPVARVERNTFICGQAPENVAGSYALRPNMGQGFRAARNIFAGFALPFADTSDIPATAALDYNVFWGPEYNSSLESGIKEQKARGVGTHNVVADPMFASPQQDDYRLLPGSPALGIEGGQNAGALDGVPADYQGAPRVRVALVPLSNVQEKDSLYPLHLPPFSCYVSQQRGIQVSLFVTSAAQVVKTRFQAGDDPAQERAFKTPDTFELPDKDGLHTVRVRVQDANGKWSDESLIYVTLRRDGLLPVGEPTITANEFGALFSAKADSRVAAKLEYHDGAKWVEAANSAYVADPEIPREVREGASFPLLVTGLAPGRPWKYRLTLSAPLSKTVKEGTFVLSGKPKTMYVSAAGEDTEDAGSRARPFKTLQFALDRALPGDRVRIMPGVYFGAQFLGHGGTKDQPLVIEGLYPNTVFLDGLRQAGSCLGLRKAPHIILRNLNVQWFSGAGISVNSSEGVRLTRCRFHNQYWISNGFCVGTGAYFAYSPSFTVDHCIFSRLYTAAVMFCASPNGKIVHNTATGGDCALVRWANWWGPNENPIIQYNSLNFNGNQSLSIQQTKDALLSKCSIDYNNYGTTFTKWPQPGARYGASVPLPFPYLPRSRELHTFTDATDPAKPATRVFYNMEDWLEFSGQDKHSTFADPKWLNPAAGRFDVKADSPNLLPDGKIIGALGYLGENPNMEPEVVVTSPYSGQTVQGDLALTADASDYDGSVRKVEFLANGQVIAEGVGGPCHKAAAVKLAPGQYAVTARAMDDRGAVGVSDAVNVIVK